MIWSPWLEACVLCAAPSFLVNSVTYVKTWFKTLLAAELTLGERPPPFALEDGGSNPNEVSTLYWDIFLVDEENSLFVGVKWKHLFRSRGKELFLKRRGWRMGRLVSKLETASVTLHASNNYTVCCLAHQGWWEFVCELQLILNFKDCSSIFIPLPCLRPSGNSYSQGFRLFLQ